MQNTADQSGTQALRILRFPDVVRKTGISRTGIYERIRASEFPEPVPLGERTIGFVEQEVDSYLRTLLNRRQKARA